MYKDISIFLARSSFDEEITCRAKEYFFFFSLGELSRKIDWETDVLKEKKMYMKVSNVHMNLQDFFLSLIEDKWTCTIG